MVKQEKARVNVDILGISELRWTGMGEFNSDERIFKSFKIIITAAVVVVLKNKRI